jgi:hypothetical protein
MQWSGVDELRASTWSVKRAPNWTRLCLRARVHINVNSCSTRDQLRSCLLPTAPAGVRACGCNLQHPRSAMHFHSPCTLHGIAHTPHTHTHTVHGTEPLTHAHMHTHTPRTHCAWHWHMHMHTRARGRLRRCIERTYLMAHLVPSLANLHRDDTSRHLDQQPPSKAHGRHCKAVSHSIISLIWSLCHYSMN